MRQIEESDYGVATAPNEVRFERSLPGPVERVWAYLTEADKRRQWLAGGKVDHWLSLSSQEESSVEQIDTLADLRSLNIVPGLRR